MKRKAAHLLYSIKVNFTAGELTTHDRLRAVIQGNAKPGKHAADAFHLVESAKNGGRFFITRDDRLLKKAPDVLRELLMAVVTPQGFLDAYIAGQKQ